MNVTPSIDIIGAGTGAITRAGPGTYTDSAGALQTAPANVLRMTYDPADLSAAPRPLIEPAATNLLTGSESFTSANGWFGCLVTASASTYRGIPYRSISKTTTGANESCVFTWSVPAPGMTYVMRIALRALNATSVGIGLYDGSTGAAWGLDSDATATIIEGPGAITSRNGGLANIEGLSATVDTVLEVSRTYAAACTGNAFIYPGRASSVVATDSVLATRGQLERDKASSYIPTTTAPVTRPADIITGTGLIYSSAIETAPAAYASGTTYAQGASVSVAGLLGALDCYTSLQGGNIGHSPASSPLYWAYAGTTYAPYASGTTFANYQRCIDPVNHLVYESLIGGNTGASLADGTKWRLVGYTNPYAAFDTLRNTRTVGANPLVMVIKPGQRINALALVGLKATSANITLLNGYEVASCVTRNLNTRDASDAYKYCFNPFSNQEAVTLYDLPPYYDGVVVISLVNAFGLAECGGVFMGTYTYIGDIQYEAESDALNFSTVTRDSEGNAEMQAERNVPKVIGQIFLDKRLVKAAYDLRDQLNGTTAVWDGLADDTDGYAAPLLIQGFYRRFTINMKYPQKAIISLELEEV